MKQILLLYCMLMFPSVLFGSAPARYPRFGDNMRLAIKNDHAEYVVKVLNKAPENINARDKEYQGRTLLSSAVGAVAPKTVEMLVMRGAQLDPDDTNVIAEMKKGFRTRKKGLKKLGLPDAEINKRLENNIVFIMQQLLDNHLIDINMQDALGATPLMFAAENGFVSLATLLLERGANSSIQDDDESVAYEYADADIKALIEKFSKAKNGA